jgi:hypothetical protein
LKTVFPFLYFVARKDKRSLRCFQTRDSTATVLLYPALAELGFNFEEPILNYPPEDPDPDDENVVFGQRELFPVDFSRFSPGDLIVQTTRPPLSDHVEKPRKTVERGHTELEERLFVLWRQYFDASCRSQIKLSPAMEQEAIGEFEGAHAMDFFEREVAPYKELNGGNGWSEPQGPCRTAVFLLRVPEAWPGGPEYLGVFGMDGISTMIWAYRLGRDLRNLLAEPAFIIAEIEFEADQIPTRCSDLRWMRDLEIKVRFRHPL